ncbi:uncharacterized protein LOC110038449 [Phalaenopsis equestris]|uniref:uncharacterized protein LOC110038449 n=1 Tax=Phalaenopsis equestris TaxID=78828 RepID=UPI0009E3210F|nr:uncharacterized protein LOC110038449 [Phalaenopsis equestris]
MVSLGFQQNSRQSPKEFFLDLSSGFPPHLWHLPLYQGTDLRTNPFQEEGNDANYIMDDNEKTSREDLIQVPCGPITRCRAKRVKEALNGLVQESWTHANSWGSKEKEPQRFVNLFQTQG